MTIAQILKELPPSYKGGPQVCNEQVIAQLYYDGYLKLDFGHTAYTTNSYLKCSSTAFQIEKGIKKLFVPILVKQEHPNSNQEAILKKDKQQNQEAILKKDEKQNQEDCLQKDEQQNQDDLLQKEDEKNFLMREQQQDEEEVLMNEFCDEGREPPLLTILKHLRKQAAAQFQVEPQHVLSVEQLVKLVRIGQERSKKRKKIFWQDFTEILGHTEATKYAQNFKAILQEQSRNHATDDGKINTQSYSKQQSSKKARIGSDYWHSEEDGNYDEMEDELQESGFGNLEIGDQNLIIIDDDLNLSGEQSQVCEGDEFSRLEQSKKRKREEDEENKSVQNFQG
eukprot:TRINITY_DN9664_c0_g1_i4.p1 TRINITY_DN9664_c0_g1~~TRINITY_DN9664_c0_g1_i4.p1  ORF type:complete len:350 (-),score=72.08 TRINITY_DN9664_c0_g1_i4:122-1135(-)